MKNLGPQQIRLLSAQVLAACQEIAKEHGLTATDDGGRYSGSAATCRIRFAVPEQAALIAQSDAALIGAKFGIGHKFRASGREFQVTGFNLRRPKYPVSAVATGTGKEYKFAVSAVTV